VVFAKRIFFYGDFAIYGTAAVRMWQAQPGPQQANRDFDLAPPF
jgi:hypothetical protein